MACRRQQRMLAGRRGTAAASPGLQGEGLLAAASSIATISLQAIRRPPLQALAAAKSLSPSSQLLFGPRWSPISVPRPSTLRLPAALSRSLTQKNNLKDLKAKAAVAETSNHRCCAERRLLASYVARARKHGVPPHAVVAWVRRKLGGCITVYRQRSDGSLGCAAPCLLCCRELQRFDLKVCCSLAPGQWFVGRVTDAGAPAPALTSGQRRQFKHWRLAAPAEACQQLGQQQLKQP